MSLPQTISPPPPIPSGPDKSTLDHALHPSSSSVAPSPTITANSTQTTSSSTTHEAVDHELANPNLPQADTDKQEKDEKAGNEDPVKYGSDLSAYNRYQNLRIWAAGSSMRNLVDGVSVWYHYRKYKDDRHSIYLDLPPDPNGDPLPRLRILIYLPTKSRSEAMPGWKDPSEKVGKVRKRGVVVHLAGGGFTMCRPENEGHLCRTFCDTLSCILISPDYCKAPQYPFPTALNQTHALLKWIADPAGLHSFLSQSGTPSIRTYLPHVDPRRICVSGGSSGGNLAAAVTVKVIKEMESDPLANGARIVGLGLIYAMLDVTIPFQEKLATVPDKSKVLPRWLTRLFLDGYLADLRTPVNAEKLQHPYLSPGLVELEDLKKFPKTVFVSAENDYLCQETETMADRLKHEAGFSIARDGNKSPPEGDGQGKLWRKKFPQVGHGFDIAPNFTKESERLHGTARDEAWGMIMEAFNQEL